MKFDLHGHQSRALDMLKASLRSGCRRPMVMAPTGFGKTLLAAAIVEGALSKGKRVLFTVPTIDLADQTHDRFAKQGITQVGIMQGYHPLTDASQPVQVATLQTLERRKLPQSDIVVIDEAHLWRQFVGQWMDMPEWENVPFVGLSATPWTRGLGKHYDDLIIAATTAELIATINPLTGRPFLSRFETFAPSHPDLSKVGTRAGDYREDELSDVMSQPKLVADVVTTWLQLGEDRPTLCFAVDRAHARKLAADFERAGVPTGYVDGDTPRDEREAVGQRLAEGQIRVVCNVGVLTTGIDWDVRCIILARPTKSEMLFTQIIGRGLRDAAGKDHCVILDHSDTTLRLGFVTDIHHDTLDDGKPKVGLPSAREREAKLPKECKKCSFLKPAGVHKCPSCGFEPTRQSRIEEHQGSLVALRGKKTGKAEATGHTRQEFWSMLLWMKENRDKSPGWTKARFHKRFEALNGQMSWPGDLENYPLEPDGSFLNWDRAQNIAYAKQQEAARKRAKAQETPLGL